MGLRRRLSKKWNETVNGVLSGPGVDVDSVNTDDATIGTVLSGDFTKQTFTLDPQTTNAVDLLAVNATNIGAFEGAHLHITCYVDNVSGTPSRKIVFASSQVGQGTNISVIDSFRENSFRNQLADPSWDSQDEQWVLSAVDSDGSVSSNSGKFRIEISGVYGDVEVLL